MGAEALGGRVCGIAVGLSLATDVLFPWCSCLRSDLKEVTRDPRFPTNPALGTRGVEEQTSGIMMSISQGPGFPARIR